MAERLFPESPLRSGIRPVQRMEIRSVPGPEPEKSKPVLSSETCQKCGAKFRWERSDPEQPKSPLMLRLLQGSGKCNCGYGRAMEIPGRKKE